MNDDLLRLGGVRGIAEKNLAVNAVICAFLLLNRTRADETKRPPLELVFVFFRECGGFVWSCRLANGNDFNFASVGVTQTAFDEQVASCVTSMPIHLRPSFSAASIVVPQPQTGSSTTSPGLLLAWMIRSSNATGFCVG